MGDDLSYGLNTLGPLCLWQCLFIHWLTSMSFNSKIMNVATATIAIGLFLK